jgi:hypothetical protein
LYELRRRHLEARTQANAERRRVAEGVAIWLGDADDLPGIRSAPLGPLVRPHVLIRNGGAEAVYLDRINSSGFEAYGEDELDGVALPPGDTISVPLGRLQEGFGYALNVTRPEILTSAGFVVKVLDESFSEAESDLTHQLCGESGAVFFDSLGGSFSDNRSLIIMGRMLLARISVELVFRDGRQNVWSRASTGELRG